MESKQCSGMKSVRVHNSDNGELVVFRCFEYPVRIFAQAMMSNQVSDKLEMGQDIIIDDGFNSIVFDFQEKGT